MNQQKLWSANYVLLLMYNLCHSLGFYITMVVFTGYCSETYGLAPGVASLSVTVYVLAAIVARLLLGKQLDRWGLKLSLVIGFVGNLVCFLLFFLPMSFPALVAVRAVHGVAMAIQSGSVSAAVVLFLVFLAYSSVVTYVVSYAGELGLGDAVSFFFVVYSAVGFIFRPIVGKRVDQKGENSVIYACFASLTVAFVLLAFVNSAPMLIVAAAFTGFGVGITQSIMQTIMARDTPKHELGRANSTFFTSMDLGLGIGPMLVGAFMPVLGFGTSYLLLAFIGPIAALLYYLMHGRKQANKQLDLVSADPTS